MKEYAYDELDENTPDGGVNYRELLFRYLHNWYWFLLAIILAFVAARLYLRYTTPLYEVTSAVLIKDDNSNGGGVGVGGADLAGLGFFTSTTSNFDNELVMLRSLTLIKKTITELDLYITHQIAGKVRDVELYKEALPIKVWMSASEASNLPEAAEVRVYRASSSLFNVTVSLDGVVYTKEVEVLPTLFTTPIGTISLSVASPSAFDDWEENRAIIATIVPPQVAAGTYRENLSVESNGKTTTIANILFKTSHKERGVDFVNRLLDDYNRDANDIKNEIATKTAQFISERIGVINAELGTTEQELELFKRGAGIIDISSDAQVAIAENSIYQQKLVENSTQLSLVQFLKEYATMPNNRYEVLPSNVGLTDVTLAALIASYNELLVERNSLLLTSSETNPAVRSLDVTIDAMRQNVLTAIASVEHGLLITQKQINEEARKYEARIAQAPTQEREFVSIARQQEIKAGLYLMLLQKREENALTLASTANNARIFDETVSLELPIFPNSRIVYMLALLLGLALPMSVMSIRDLFRFKIESRADVERLTNVPVVGDIPTLKEKPMENSIVVFENKNDMMAEAFRNLRTNVKFLLKGEEKVVLITSTSSGEGKSFIATNLAISFALMGKKTLIVGLDIRKPGLNKALGASSHLNGISSYLSESSRDLMSLVVKSDAAPLLDVLYGGAIPPNPTELVSREALPQAIAMFRKQYDYVVLDSAPIGMVTDTQIIAEMADASIYVCRADYTHMSDYNLINELATQRKLRNLCTVINGVDVSKKRYGYGRRYGYGYGYGYGVEK